MYLYTYWHNFCCTIWCGRRWNCANNKSYIVKDFENAKVLSPQNIIDIKNIFKNYNQEDDDINISIKQKDSNLVGQMASQGTTPRQLTDLIGSLCDLTSGSGDKGTPIVFIQGYFDNFADE